MDTSKKYILMCEKAEEIQRQKSWTDAEPKDFWEPSETSEFIWLPRQDQLQEMICETKDDCYGIFVNGCYEDNNWSNLNSMEQLWLAFVMKLEYNKHWNGKEWKN